MKRPVVRLVLLALFGSTAQSGSGQVLPPPPLPVPVSPLTPPEATNAPVRPLDQAPNAGAPTTDPVRSFFDPHPVPLNLVRMAGLPAGSQPEVLTWSRVYRLALIHAQVVPPPRFAQLDPVRLEEQAGALGLDDFAKFRASYVSSRTFRDPAPDFLDLQTRLLDIEAAYRNLAFAERWSQLLREMINGEASGLGQTDIDQADAAVQSARRRWLGSVADYRDRLDLFKVALGLAPAAAVTIDLEPVAAFREVFEELDRWGLSAKRELSDLDQIVAQLPPIVGPTIQGRRVLDELIDDPNRLADVLALATRFALGNRLGRDEAADEVELRVRRRLRHLAEIHTHYLIEGRELVLAIRLLDGRFEQVIAPPAGAVPPRPGQVAAGLTATVQDIAQHRGRLVALWTSFQAESLLLERDLGLILVPDWPAFLGRFVAHPRVVEAARPADGDRPMPIPVAPVPPPAPPAAP